MKPSWLAATIVTLLFTGQPVQGIDLAKIDRTIRKEPAYQTETPKYCLVVFGPKGNARAWLVLDGDFLYVDRNGNGDLTEEVERIDIKKPADTQKSPIQGNINAGPILGADDTKYDLRFRRSAKGKLGVATDFLGGQFVGSTVGREDLIFGDAPKTAPIIYLNGPLTFRLVNPPTKLAPGDRLDLAVLFGTPGLGKGTFVYMVQRHDSRPTATIRFPGKNSGDPPITVKVALAGGSKPGFVGG